MKQGVAGYLASLKDIVVSDIDVAIDALQYLHERIEAVRATNPDAGMCMMQVEMEMMEVKDKKFMLKYKDW